MTCPEGLYRGGKKQQDLGWNLVESHRRKKKLSS